MYISSVGVRKKRAELRKVFSSQQPLTKAVGTNMGCPATFPPVPAQVTAPHVASERQGQRALVVDLSWYKQVQNDSQQPIFPSHLTSDIGEEGST